MSPPWRLVIPMLITIFLLILGLAQAQMIFPGACPLVNVMTDFDIRNFTGTWYEYAKYPYMVEWPKRCVTVDYIADEEYNTVTEYKYSINEYTGAVSNKSRNVEVFAPGQLLVGYPQNQRTQTTGKQRNLAKKLILGTDYVNYSVIYDCMLINELVGSAKFLWIMTRQRNPSDEVIQDAMKVVTSQTLLPKYLLSTFHDNCYNQTNETATESPVTTALMRALAMT